MDTRNHQIELFSTSLKAKGKRPATIESYCRDAADFLDFAAAEGCHIDEVDPTFMESFTLHLQQKDKSNSIRRKIIGVRQYFRYISEQNSTYESPLDCYPIPVRDESLPQGLEHLEADEILDHLNSLRDQLKGTRDLAIYCLLAFEGLKASELIDLKWSSFIQSQHSASLQILGPRARVIVLEDKTKQAILSYKRRLKKITDQQRFDYLFISFKGRDGLYISPRITRHGLKFLLYEIGAIAGINHLNTEMLRHYSITWHLESGKSPAEVMAHLGLRRIGNIAKHVHQLVNSPS